MQQNLGDLIDCSIESQVTTNNCLQLDQCAGQLIEHLVFLHNVHGTDVDPKVPSPMHGSNNLPKTG